MSTPLGHAPLPLRCWWPRHARASLIHGRRHAGASLETRPPYPERRAQTRTAAPAAARRKKGLRAPRTLTSHMAAIVAWHPLGWGAACLPSRRRRLERVNGQVGPPGSALSRAASGCGDVSPRAWGQKRGRPDDLRAPRSPVAPEPPHVTMDAPRDGGGVAAVLWVVVPESLDRGGGRGGNRAIEAPVAGQGQDDAMVSPRIRPRRRVCLCLCPGVVGEPASFNSLIAHSSCAPPPLRHCARPAPRPQRCQRSGLAQKRSVQPAADSAARSVRARRRAEDPRLPCGSSPVAAGASGDTRMRASCVLGRSGDLGLWASQRCVVFLWRAGPGGQCKGSHRAGPC